jgi:hypothetical protein
MKTGYDILSEQRFLFSSLIIIGFIFLIANLINEEDYPLTENWYPTDILYIIIPAIAIIIGTALSIKYKGKGNHGKGWILLTLAVASWYAGEMTFVYDNAYDVEDIATFTSDIFYLIGYPLFFAFAVFYLKARKRIISKKMILATSIVSLALVIPSLYVSFDLNEEKLESVDVIIMAIYPILDGVILSPALVGMILFFKGEVNLLWTLLMMGLLCYVVGDTFYLGSYIDDSYYPGHVSDIFYLWGYTLFAFGFYSHLRLYKKEPPKQPQSLNYET